MSSKLKHPPGLIIEKPKKNINPHPNIIRQPYGPMEHRNFKVFKYNLYPREFDEFDYVIPQAYIPKEYIIKDTWISKYKDKFEFLDVYLTENKDVCFYKNKNQLCRYLNLNDGYLVYKKIINDNYFIVFKLNSYHSTMYRVKDKKHLKMFWYKLKSLCDNL
mgnify:CR=1 FL=1